MSNGGCNCASSCNCGDNCNCNYPKLSLHMSNLRMGYVDEATPSAAESGGCSCGSNCSCNPCNCK